MKKLYGVLVLIGAASLFYYLGAMQTTIDPQKALYAALKNGDANEVYTAVEDLKAKPMFVIEVEGTRTVKQVNALNFALQYYNQTRDELLLQVMLRHLSPEQLREIIDYEDQFEQQTPRDIVALDFVDEQDLYAWLGKFSKRQFTFNADEDEAAYQACQ